MKDAHWRTPEIPGIAIQKCHFHSDNPSKDQPHPRLLDGWLEVLIENTGNNPFYPQPRRYAFVFIRHTDDGPPLSVKGPENVRYVLLRADEEIVTGNIKEESLDVPVHGTIFGLWLDLTLRTKSGTRELRTLITQMQQVPPA